MRSVTFLKEFTAALSLNNVYTSLKTKSRDAWVARLVVSGSGSGPDYRVLGLSPELPEYEPKSHNSLLSFEYKRRY